MDWVASALTLLGNVFVIKKKWYAFVIFFVANCMWAYWWFMHQQWAAMILVALFLGQNVWGYIQWRKVG